MPTGTTAQALPEVPTWAWFLLAWMIAILFVAPWLGRHLDDGLDDDWP